MKINKSEVPEVINIPGAVARQQLNFGDASDCGTMDAGYFTVEAGADMAPLLEGLENDLCQSPHWGYIVKGEVITTYADGPEETLVSGDLFYMPPGHTVRFTKDSEFVIFSPQHEHCAVVNHIQKQLAKA